MGTVSVLAMISKSGIKELQDFLLDELDNLGKSVWFIVSVSKEKTWNLMFFLRYFLQVSTLS